MESARNCTEKRDKDKASFAEKEMNVMWRRRDDLHTSNDDFSHLISVSKTVDLLNGTLLFREQLPQSYSFTKGEKCSCKNDLKTKR